MKLYRLFQPSFIHAAATARWMAHTIDWGVLTTTSTRKGFEGAPFANPQSFVDGGCNNSTGVLYFYVAGADQSMKDIQQNQVSLFSGCSS